MSTKTSSRKFKLVIDRKIAVASLIGLITGMLLVVALRFVLVKPELTHYHANFAVFIDGKRQQFKGPGYYEEIQACSAEESPRGRVHMHQPDNNVVHVHDQNVTWGQFFEGLGWSLGSKVLETNDGIYSKNDLKFYIDGQLKNSPFDEVIKDEETLVIVVGKSNQSKSEITNIAKKPTPAHQANVEKDPAACRGTEELSLNERLKRAIWQ